MEFTKEKTNIAKGVAICLMLVHHLYAFSDRLLNGNTYIPVFPFFNAEAAIGDFGNICVSIFLFLSGYGMYSGYIRSKKKTAFHYALKKIKDFYLTYWVYFFIFIPIGIFFFKDVTLWNSERLRYSTEPVTFFKNLLGWESIYNQEWWFVKPFVIILFALFPIYANLAEKNFFWVAFISILLFCFRVKVSYYGSLGFAVWQTPFALGIICYKTNFFCSKIIQFLEQLGWVKFTLLLIFFLIICFVIRIELDPTYDFLVVPFFIYFSVRITETIQLDKVFAYLGTYSFPIWLIHSFFCYYYFQDLIYFPRWSPLIFALLLTASLLSVLGIEYLVLQLRYLAMVCIRKKD